MVRRMVGPDRVSATALSEETGVPQPTLSRWLRGSRTVSAMTSKNDKPTEQSEAPKKRPEDWTAEEKLRAVAEAARLDDKELGAFLRREGLHQAQLDEWRSAAMGALTKPPKRPSRGRTRHEKRIRQLEGELRRKEKALAETAALLVLQGKAEALWGAGGANTDKKSEK